MGNRERILGAVVEALGSACPGIRIYTETPFRLTPPRMAMVIPKEAVGAALLDVRRREHNRDLERVRARMERDILGPLWRQLYEEFAATEARTKAMRPAIGKPLSRRARRRNRGRVRAAKAVLMRRFSPSVTWAWPDTARAA